MFPHAWVLSSHLSVSSVFSCKSHFARGGRHKGFHTVPSRLFRGCSSKAWHQSPSLRFEKLCLERGACWSGCDQEDTLTASLRNTNEEVCG